MTQGIRSDRRGPDATASDVARILRGHDRMLVAAHGNPDGDAIGATVAMGWLLANMGKHFVLYNDTGVPPHLAWLQSPSPIVTELSELPFCPELIVVLDCGDVWRLGNDLAKCFSDYASVSLDHHLGNPGYASLGNLVDPEMAATGQIVAAVADAAGVSLTGGMAEGIYLSLISDTGSFSFGNTTPEVLELTARMMRLGLQAERIRACLDSQWTMAKMSLWGRLSQRIHREVGGLVAMVEVTQADFVETGAVRSDLEGFVELLRRLIGVRVGMLVREDMPRRIKISLRSRGSDDVRSLAAAFGGGGHVNAAGATLNMTREEAVALLLAMLQCTLSRDNAV